MKGFENIRDLLEEYLKGTELRHDSFSFETSYIKFGCNFTTISWVKISELLMNPLECKGWSIYEEKPKIVKIKLYAYLDRECFDSGESVLNYLTRKDGESIHKYWRRCPKEDKEVEIEE